MQQTNLAILVAMILHLNWLNWQQLCCFSLMWHCPALQEALHGSRLLEWRGVRIEQMKGHFNYDLSFLAAV